MQFRIEIDCGNAAFGENQYDTEQEVVRILREAADKLEFCGFDHAYLYDYNGNRVGSADFEVASDV